MGGRGGGGAMRHSIYQETMAHGGITIDLEGHQPHDGLVYAPSKDTEVKILRSTFTQRQMTSYINHHQADLARRGAHLGLWTEGKYVYLDVSRVGSVSRSTISKAQKASQLGVFNLKTFKTINIGRIDRGGRYAPLRAASRLYR